MRVLIILVAVTLTACMSYGTKVSPDKVTQFVKGKTTYTEVIQTLGKPTHSTILSDGSRMATYSYGQHQMNAASFIPFAGLFVRGSQLENTNVTLRFDQDSILIDYSASEGGMSTGTGILSGRKQE